MHVRVYIYSDTEPFSARDAPYAPSALLTSYTENGDTSTVLLVQTTLVKATDHPELDESVAHCLSAQDEDSLRILCAVSSSIRRYVLFDFLTTFFRRSCRPQLILTSFFSMCILAGKTPR